MKILLVSNRQSLGDLVHAHFRPHGSELIHYWNPIKAMDNLDEIAPDVVLFSARDFPRHWKPFVAFLRDQRSRDATVFILLDGQNLSEEEAEKAQHLQVNALVSEALDDNAELDRLKEVVSRYKKLDEGRTEHRYVPHGPDDIHFAFTHPTTFQIVTGTVVDVSSTGLRFVPENPHALGEIAQGRRLEDCSLQLGDEIVTVTCTVVRPGKELGLRFEARDPAVVETIRLYIEGSSERLLHHQI
ncbi:MAG: PilZ domain-containing protein [Spirochaetaceae bacterium]